MQKIVGNLIQKAKEAKATVLDLGNCGLRTWPEALFQLKDLEELILSNGFWDEKRQTWVKNNNSGLNNRLDIIPDKIKNLSNLKILRIGRHMERSLGNKRLFQSGIPSESSNLGSKL